MMSYFAMLKQSKNIPGSIKMMLII